MATVDDDVLELARVARAALDAFIEPIPGTAPDMTTVIRMAAWLERTAFAARPTQIRRVALTFDDLIAMATDDEVDTIEEVANRCRQPDPAE